MSIAARTTRTVWEGSLESGSGTLDHGSSKVLDGLGVTWAARTEAPGGRTSPEELAAAAHSFCFSMALALTLDKHRTPPQRLEVGSTVTLDEVDGAPTITSAALTVRGQVDDLDADGFAIIVDEAAALCPVSRLFAGANVTVQAELVQG